MSAFFMLVVFSFASANALDRCQLSSKSNTEQAIVKWVYYGDTLLVTNKKGGNKRKIRIIGIDTPEVKHHQQKAQLYGAKAREELRVLLKKANYQVILEYDKEKYDRYKRILAHVYLANGVSISEWLLQQGFAKTLIIPPNVSHVNCYKKAELLAQKQKLKIWKLNSNKLKTLQELKAKNKGYVRLKARIKKIQQQKKTIVLVLDSDSKKPIQIRIRKKNLRYFKNVNPINLKAQEVIISGILKNKKNKRTITISHESQIELLNMTKKSKKQTPPIVKWSLVK